MRAKQSCVLATTESRANIWRQEDAFKLSPPPPPPPPGWLRLLFLLLLICCLMYFRLFVGALCLFLICFALLYVHSYFAIILKRKRKLAALLLLSYRCLATVNVLQPLLTVPWVVLQCVVVVFPDHTHFFPFIYFLSVFENPVRQ